MPTLYNKSNTCTSFNRCKNFRDCPECANIRTARICDITELASRFSDNATYSVIMPIGEAQNQTTMRAVKTKLTRSLKAKTNGVLCSVETSPNKALHLNLILTHPTGELNHHINRTIEKIGIEADIFTEVISKNDIRKVTAYSLKRQSIPTRDEYAGDTISTSGDIRTLKSIMQSPQMIKKAPLVALKSMSDTLGKMGLPNPTIECDEGGYLSKSAEKLIIQVQQLDKLNACYDPKYGIITAEQFEREYHTKWMG